MVLDNIPTDSQVANTLTKPLAKGKFKTLRDKLHLVEGAYLAKRVLVFIAPSLFSRYSYYLGASNFRLSMD